MRDRVTIELGGVEYALLPTFEVVDVFEGRFGGLPDHFEKLVNGVASITTRAVLVLEGLKAAEPSKNWKLEDVKKRMFERGLWDASLIRIEGEFIERLMFTPEQYQRKKEQEKADQEVLTGAVAAAFSPSSSELPPSS